MTIFWFFAVTAALGASVQPESVTFESAAGVGAPLAEASDVLGLYADIRARGSTFPFEGEGAPGGVGRSLMAPSMLRVLTAISSNHFNEAKDMILTVTKCMPNVQMRLTDMGLKASQLEWLERIPGVSVSPFDFSRYPPQVRRLSTYKFKMLILHETVEEWWNRGHPKGPRSVMWLDASVRFLCRDPEEREEFSRGLTGTELLLRKEGFTFLRASNHSNFATAGPHERKYFPAFDEALMDSTQYGGGTYAMNFTPSALLTIAKWLPLCAMTEGCSPPRGGCKRRIGYIGPRVYAGCSRQDQTVMNIVAGNRANWIPGRYYYPFPLTVMRKPTHFAEEPSP